jgi:gamma-glutamyltranspeptidase/glutathione hydrolase
MNGNWRDRTDTVFSCRKQPASGSRGMVVSNHPLASAAGAEMLAAGGNAIDAAIATLFTLTVVEPMMVGIIGGGMAHIRLADGSHRFIDGQSTVPLAVRPDTYRSKPGSPHDVFDTVDNENLNGPKAVAVPGSLKAWCETLRRFGTMNLADVMQPAIKHASRGFAATPYLHECIVDSAKQMRQDKAISAIYLPNGTPLNAGERVVQAEYAATLATISRDGEAALYQGPLGDILVDYMKAHGGFVSREDLASYRTVERSPVRADYRGWEILGPPPPAASGVHIAQMLNILEGYDIAIMGFGSAATIHHLAEVLKIAFADRAAASGDPDFIGVPVERLTSKAYADERRRAIDSGRAQQRGTGVAQLEGAHTTHMTAADAMGNVVATTQTINNLLGEVSGSGSRHRAEQLHESLRSPARTRLVAGAGQARHHLDVACHGVARRQAGLCARVARRKEDFSKRVAGAAKPDRSRHELAGGGRGAADLDRGQCARGRIGGSGCGVRQADIDGSRGRCGADRGRGHERHPVPRGRLAHGRSLLARRRHADRPCRRAGACGGSIWAGVTRRKFRTETCAQRLALRDLRS